MHLANTLRFLLTHPLGRPAKLSALGRFARWQLASRLSPGPIAVPFVGDARLLVEHGMTGATGNVYVGLHEFADMAFVLHALREGDLFLDVGANVGSYTILAAKAVGCDCISIEPIDSTVRRLRDNIALNDVGGRVSVHACAVGEGEGFVRMTATHDTVNRVVGDGHDPAESVVVPCRPLDAVVGTRVPTVMKMDLEGYEATALKGAVRILERPQLRACILETLDAVPDVGPERSPIAATLASHGFHPATYNPWSRTLESRSTLNHAGNTLFVRDFEWARDRIASAPRFRVVQQLV